MNLIRRLPRATFSMVTLFVLSLVILAWITGDSFGQQGAPSQAKTGPNTKIRKFRGQWNITGSLHVRVSIPEHPNDANALKEFEDVTEVAFDDHWAVLHMVENEENATLVLPRESLVYLKVWEVKDEEETPKRTRQ